jgi:hypothetical protein
MSAAAAATAPAAGQAPGPVAALPPAPDGDVVTAFLALLAGVMLPPSPADPEPAAAEGPALPPVAERHAEIVQPGLIGLPSPAPPASPLEPATAVLASAAGAAPPLVPVGRGPAREDAATHLDSGTAVAATPQRGAPALAVVPPWSPGHEVARAVLAAGSSSRAALPMPSPAAAPGAPAMAAAVEPARAPSPFEAPAGVAPAGRPAIGSVATVDDVAAPPPTRDARPWDVAPPPSGASAAVAPATAERPAPPPATPPASVGTPAAPAEPPATPPGVTVWSPGPPAAPAPQGARPDGGAPVASTVGAMGTAAGERGPGTGPSGPSLQAPTGPAPVDSTGDRPGRSGADAGEPSADEQEGPRGEAVTTATAPRSAAPRDASGAGSAAAADDVVRQLSSRLGTLPRAGRHELVLQLDPPSLGTVRIEATLDGGQLTLRIHAEDVAARDLLEQGLPRLRQALEREGSTAERVSVQLGLQSDGHPPSHGAALARPVPPTPMDQPPASPQPRRRGATATARAAIDLWI